MTAKLNQTLQGKLDDLMQRPFSELLKARETGILIGALYERLSPDLQDAVDSMFQICASPEVTSDEFQMAITTIAEALIPTNLESCSEARAPGTFAAGLTA